MVFGSTDRLSLLRRKAMTEKEIIEKFLSFENIAVYGVSSKKKNFGSMVFTELTRRGYNVFIMHPHADSIGGEKCYKSLDSLPDKPDGVVLIIPPGQTEVVVKEVYDAGINYVWMQNGARSDEAVKYCMSRGINVVSQQCIIMFLEKPGFLHGFHKWVWKVAGKIPA